jgi:TolB-like protein
MPSEESGATVSLGARFGLRAAESVECGGQYKALPRLNRRVVAVSVAAAILILAGAGFYYWRNRAGQGIESLAVLPFVNSSGSPDAEYLSDGITDSLMDSLSQLPNLKVMSHSAVFRYKGKDPDARAAGRELGVRAVVTGRIDQRGDNLSVSAELVDVDGNSHLWGEQYNGTAADALAVQREIAAEISGKLRIRLSNQQNTQIARRQTANPEAYQLYLKGQYYAAKFDAENMNKGLDYFHQALKLDPNYAQAYPQTPRHIAQIRAIFIMPADGRRLRFQRHPTPGAIARAVRVNFRVHRARVDRFGGRGFNFSCRGAALFGPKST